MEKKEDAYVSGAAVYLQRFWAERGCVLQQPIRRGGGADDVAGHVPAVLGRTGA